MPQAVFVVHLDDYQGFIVEKRYPFSFSLNEKLLNLIFYEHEKEEKESLRYSEIDNSRIVSFVDRSHPRWMACFVLSAQEDYEELKAEISGMGRLILELMIEDPKTVHLEEILKNHSVLEEANEEQRYAQVFLTPSSALVLEKIESEGIEKAAKLAIWLRTQVQSNSVDLREAIFPLMNSGLVKVEVVGNVTETVFLVKDVFAYRAPPVDAITRAGESMPKLAGQYQERVAEFFTPPPPSRGYNPTIPSNDPNSPLVEDREKIARVVSRKIEYKVLDSLRDEPLTVKQISEKTLLPGEIVQNALLSLESDRVAAQLGAGVWALIANPVMESFMPEFVLAMIAEKLSAKEITREIAKRHLEILAETWSGEQ